MPKARTKPITDPENALGKAYAVSLRERAMAIRSGLALTRHAREGTASDLETLALIAELMPEVFGRLPK